MSNNRKSKAFSKIVTISIIAILFSSITISIVAWNYGLQGSQNDNVESEIPNEDPTEPNEPTIPEEPEEPTSPQPNPEPEIPNEEPTERESNENPTTPPISPVEWAHVRIGSVDYSFSTYLVNTTRPDIFHKGKFSMFDILVHLDQQNEIELEYHFDKSMTTHIIDSINGEPNWWYVTYYDGGWSEQNVFRPDHYPWKPLTTLRFFQTIPQNLAEVYSVWKEEIQRLENNNGTVIIPQVIIKGSTFETTFMNVEVTPHNLRNDTFQEHIITAIDVILSLGDIGKIDYELKWYDHIGTANIVRSYWVERINDDQTSFTSGFMYEAGADIFRGFYGNHIHLPSDTRIINSPEYVEYYWLTT